MTESPMQQQQNKPKQEIQQWGGELKPDQVNRATVLAHAYVKGQI